MLNLSHIAAVVSTCAFALTASLWSAHLLLRGSPPPTAPALPNHIAVEDLSNVDILLPVPTEMLLSTDPKAHQEATGELIEQIEVRWPDDHRRAFLSAVAPHALVSARENCVPPSVTLAQAILESGWGRSKLAKRHNNLFGMKSGSRGGGVKLLTREVTEGKSATQRARFRTYEEWDQSIADHGQLLAEDPRYAQAREKWEHWPLFLQTLAPIYATDPKYIARISSLVDDYQLDQWDSLVTEVAQRRATCAKWTTN
jgi:flagellum-specific peptidoglycan hydrolase FlgJ